MATDFFLKLDGIAGESIDAKHSGEIQLQSWSWGLTQSGTFSAGTGGSGGKVSIQDIHFTKLVCTATSPLIKHVTDGKHIATGKLTARKSSGDQQIEYLVVDLTDIIVTSYQTGGVAQQDDMVTEALSLNFAQFKLTYSKQSNKGVAEPQTPVGWNVQKNAKV